MMRSKSRQYMVQVFNYSLLLGTAIWVALMIRAAHMLRDASQPVYEVTFGPLLLATIRKEGIAGGSTVQFDLGSGLLWYAAFWLAVSGITGLVLLGYIRKRRINSG